MRILVVSAFALLSVNAFAVTPAQVCQTISNFSASNGAMCAQAISRSNFDNGAVEVAYALATAGSTSSATQVMQMSGNRYLDDNAAEVCKKIAPFSGSNAVACVTTSLDNAFDPSLTRIAAALASSGSTSSAVTALQNARNAVASPGAAAVCETIAPYSGSNAASCVTAIINKEYFNNSESVCMTLARNGSTSSAVTCLQSSGVSTERRPGRRGQYGGGYNNGGYGDSRPAPQARISMSMEDFRDLTRSVQRARNLYDRSQYNQLGNALIDLDRKLDEIQAQR